MTNPIVRAGHKLLEIPICYDLFQSSVGSVKFRKKYISESISNFDMDSVVDLGCGTASTADLLPKSVSYLGVDVSEKYLKKAKLRVTNRDSLLIKSDIANPNWVNSAFTMKKSLGVALGIYHHINDDQLKKTIFNLGNLLKPGSRIVSLDPVIDKETTISARWFAQNDRGKFVREPEEYKELFQHFGFSVEMKIERKAFRIPYDLLLIKATKEG